MKIYDHEIKLNKERWKNILVGYVVGSKPYVNHLKAAVLRMWKLKSNMQVFMRDNCYFFFQLSDGVDCEMILQEGPWLFDGTLIVKRWSSDIALERDMLTMGQVSKLTHEVLVQIHHHQDVMLHW